MSGSMTGEIEGAADAITGGLIARAVEPGAGEAPHGRGGACLNCGTALAGDFCHACGQRGHLHRSMIAIWHDIAHGVFHFEGKIWRTLPMLFWRPGELTRRYIHGERARFVSPMAIFLFSVFLMFALLSAFGTQLYLDEENRSFGNIAASKGAEKRTELDAELAMLDRKLATAKAAGMSRGDLAEVTGAIKRKRAALAGEKRFLKGGPNALTDEQRGKFIDGIRTGWPRLDKGIEKANENPNLLLYKLQTNAYKFSWALIPISVPFVWLLFFWRRRYKVYDHTIFVIYSLSFMTLFGTLLTLLWWAGIPMPVIAVAAWLYPAFHMYRQLKGGYELGRMSAILRAVLLWNFASIALVLFVLFLFWLGLIG